MVSWFTGASLLVFSYHTNVTLSNPLISVKESSDCVEWNNGTEYKLSNHLDAMW
jgi:hypothetical protein